MTHGTIGTGEHQEVIFTGAGITGVGTTGAGTTGAGTTGVGTTGAGTTGVGTTGAGTTGVGTTDGIVDLFSETDTMEKETTTITVITETVVLFLETPTHQYIEDKITQEIIISTDKEVFRQTEKTTTTNPEVTIRQIVLALTAIAAATVITEEIQVLIQPKTTTQTHIIQEAVHLDLRQEEAAQEIIREEEDNRL